jgi:preprotein translocase subunit SecY
MMDWMHLDESTNATAGISSGVASRFTFSDLTSGISDAFASIAGSYATIRAAKAPSPNPPAGGPPNPVATQPVLLQAAMNPWVIAGGVSLLLLVAVVATRK